ncbi:MAG: glycosyltransferase family 9 protein [Bacteroidales bacterium]|nr:glycosyltransferase family 9 protein [Bacteroidales bacterium]
MVKFLVVRFSSIGDIILTTPVVRHLKQQVEDAQVHFLTKSAFVPLLEANPYIDRIHSFDGDIKACISDLKNEGIDYIIDLHHNTRSARIKFSLKRMDFSVNKLNRQKWLYVNFKLNRLPDVHMVDRNLETIRTFISEKDKGGLDYFIPEQERIDVSSLPEAFQNGYIALAIGAQHQTKKLPVESLVELCRKLSFPVIILGGPTDKETGVAIIDNLPGKTLLNTCGMYTIHQSASAVQQAGVLITHDTGLMHIGAAFNKKIITIWGNTVPAFGMFPFRADPSSVQFEVSGLKCRPCSKIGYQRCPKKHFRCMLEQDIDAIANTANRLFLTTAR